MYSEKSSFQDKIRQHPILVIFVILQIVFLIILGVVLGNLSNENQGNLTGEAYEESRPQLTIENLAKSVDFLSGDDISNIQKTLFDKIMDNNNSLKASDVKADVREGTVRTFEADGIGMNLLSFIVDVPSLEQSYQVFYEYADKELELENPTSVLCLDNWSEKRYDNFSCRGSGDDDTRRGVVAMYLGGAEFNDFAVSMDEGRKVITMDVFPNIVVDEEKRNGYIDEVKRAIEDLGMSPEMFEYRVMTPDEIVDSLEEGEIYGG